MQKTHAFGDERGEMRQHLVQTGVRSQTVQSFLFGRTPHQHNIFVCSTHVPLQYYKHQRLMDWWGFNGTFSTNRLYGAFKKSAAV